MKILLSAYTARPGRGTEYGAGYSLVRAAASLGPVWVLTHPHNARSLEGALANHPTTHAVTIVPLQVQGRLAGPGKGVPTGAFHSSTWQRLAGQAAVELDTQHDFDVVHHATLSAFWLPIGVSRLRKPLVVGPLSGGCLTPRSLWSQLGVREAMTEGVRMVVTRSGGAVRRHVWKHAPPVVIAQEAETAAYLRRWVLPPNTPIHVHPNASEPDIEPWPIFDRDAAGEVLFIGRLRAWKGTALAIEAFLDARLGDDVKLTFIGAGPDRDRLERMVRKRRADDLIRFTGHLSRPEVLRRLRSAKALLFPSFHDSAGFVVSEALTMGVPVVCIGHGGPAALTELWPNTGYVTVPPGSGRQVVHDLATALREVTSRPALRPEHPVLPSRSLAHTLQVAYSQALLGETGREQTAALYSRPDGFNGRAT